MYHGRRTLPVIQTLCLVNITGIYLLHYHILDKIVNFDHEQTFYLIIYMKTYVNINIYPTCY